MVFASAVGRVWVTTSRGSVKAGRGDGIGGRGSGPLGDRTAAFTGTVTTYDLLDTGTWALARAGDRCSRSRGCASRRRTPGSSRATRWTPTGFRSPGRRRARLRGDPARAHGDPRVRPRGERLGRLGRHGGGCRTLPGRSRGRVAVGERARADPGRSRRERGGRPRARHGRGPVVLPVRWAIDGGERTRRRRRKRSPSPRPRALPRRFAGRPAVVVARPGDDGGDGPGPRAGRRRVRARLGRWIGHPDRTARGHRTLGCRSGRDPSRDRRVVARLVVGDGEPP